MSTADPIDPVWHPFTQEGEYGAERDRVVIVRGRGAYLYDRRGRKFLDGHSSLWVNLHGHRHPRLDAAIRRQLGRVAHSTLLGQDNDVATRLAGELVRLSRREGLRLDRVFYSDDGSTAVEAAIKIALQYWQNVGQPRRDLFVSFRNGYHGDTLGAVSVGGINLFHERFKPLLFRAATVPVGDAAALERLVKTRGRRIAAILIEPGLQAAGGILPLPRGFLREVDRLRRKAGALLIADEVAVGFGRTGTMFACSQERVSPDLLCLAKGLTAGYLPLAATLATEKIYAAFLGAYGASRHFFHGHSYTGNALACAAALANLEIFKREKTLGRVRQLANILRRELDRLRRMPHVVDVRQVGLIAGVELASEADRMGYRVCLEARRRGVLLRPLGNVIPLMPPYVISARALARLVRVLGESIRAVVSLAALAVLLATAVPAWTDGGRAAELVKRGLAAYIDGRAKEALNIFHYATTLDPADPNARKMLKLVADENPALRIEEKLTPGMNLVEHKLYKALRAIVEDRYTVAAAECSEVLEMEPQHALAMIRLGAARYAVGQTYEAREIWLKAKARDPKNPDLLAFLNVPSGDGGPGAEPVDFKRLTPTPGEEKAMGGAATQAAFQRSLNYYRSRAAAGARPEERAKILRRIVEKYEGQGIDLSAVKADLAEQERKIAAQIKSEETRRRAAAAAQAADSKAQKAARDAFEADLSQYRLTASTLNKTARREALEKIILKHRAAGVDTGAATKEMEKVEAAPW